MLMILEYCTCMYAVGQVIIIRTMVMYVMLNGMIMLESLLGRNRVIS